MSAEEFTKDEEILRMTNLLDNVISDYQDKLKDAEQSVETKESAFYEIGVELAKANKAIKLQHPQKKEEVIAKNKFTALKLNVASKLKKHRSNIDKVVRVAEFCETTHYTKHKERLPSSWSSLYLISGYDEKKLDKLMENSEINSDISRVELAKKLIKKPKKKTHELKIISPKKATKEEIELFEEFLQSNNVFEGWAIKTK
jgi:hypothetical protein